MRIGCIGTGSMGGMLVEAFSTRLPGPPDIVACNRSREKIAALVRRFPNVVAVATAAEVAQRAEVLFVCVKPPDVEAVVEQIRPFLSPDHVLLSTASTPSMESLESRVPAKVGKLIPSITQLAGAGVILTHYGPRMDEGDRDRADRLLSAIGVPVPVSEEQIRVHADLTSCGPAFFAALIESFARSAARTGRIDALRAEELLRLTWIGTARLFEAGLTAEQILRRVAVPGGVTEAGLRVLRDRADRLFEDLLAATEERHAGRAAYRRPPGHSG
ncbi:MAG: pyrroline-5-carboxylate reductase dimerization domain-containing protein [Alicyclobacillaceae bacterium]|nr:pyrroline-5-carboxylate reductase dimerization domain-containing protein [Alicyclobacillaceae bacterium]